jgi:hypothetical protein
VAANIVMPLIIIQKNANGKRKSTNVRDALIVAGSFSRRMLIRIGHHPAKLSTVTSNRNIWTSVV